jgi:large subunit ribosomal protein L17
MRHNNKINHLGRTHAHREALLSNMAVSLVKHKRIFTTLAKAKELRKYIEPLITKSKDDTTHSRRIVFRNLRDKYAVTELFNDVSKKIGDRPGGYTRIIKTGNRLGDNASMCFIELVDYNELMLKDLKAPLKTKTRRSKRKADDNVSKDAPKATTVRKTATENKTVETPQAPVIEEKTETPIVETPVVALVEETPEVETPVAEIPAEEVPSEETSEAEDTPKEE